jgi:hypothetical protein
MELLLEEVIYTEPVNGTSHLMEVIYTEPVNSTSHLLEVICTEPVNSTSHLMKAERLLLFSQHPEIFEILPK